MIDEIENPVLSEILQKMPEKDKELLTLYVIEGYTVTDIAKTGRQYSSESQQENPTVKKYFKKFSESGCGLSLPAAYPLKDNFSGKSQGIDGDGRFLIVH